MLFVGIIIPLDNGWTDLVQLKKKFVLVQIRFLRKEKLKSFTGKLEIAGKTDLLSTC